MLIASLVASPVLAGPPAPTQLPTGGQVVAGQAAISQQAARMDINQQSNKAIINWQGFDIGSQAQVNFNQPSASSVALNRVLSSNPSQIYGQLNANGQVFLVNPNGIVFGKGSQVNVGGLVASTLDITNENFLNGKYEFNRGSATGSILNQGNIKAKNGGTVALLAPKVINEGIVSARMGSVVLASGDKVTLDAGANGLIQVAVEPSTIESLIHNKELIKADGGQVIMTAKAAGKLQGGVVKNSGVVQAKSIGRKNGRILLLGDMQHGSVQLSGTLDASAPASKVAPKKARKGKTPTAANGGFIETSAARVEIADTARVTTKADNGQTGTWLIDPTDFTINPGSGAQTSSSIGATTLQTNLASSNITIQTDNGSGTDAGDIHVNAPVTWGTNTLTLNAWRDININQTLDASGGGSLTLNYGQGAANGVISGRTAQYNVQAPIELHTSSVFKTQLGSSGTPITYTVISAHGSNNATALTALQNIQSSLSGNFVLGSNIDASTTSGWNGGQGWKPIGDNSTDDADSRFSGVFDGLGHTISDLTIDRSGQDTLGLFGYIDTASVLRNIGIKDADIKGQTGIGILAGINHGTISNGWSTGVINATTSGIGGLVGLNKGDIKTSWSNANITVSGTGEVSGHGGLAGYNYKFIEDSYALGSVNGNIAVGGLVGGNVVSGGNNGIIRNSFAMGQVSGRESSTTGGLVGNNWSAPGNIQNSYWVKQTTGQSATGGLNGSGIAINTLADLQAALPAGFDTSVWANADNQSTPYLKSTSHSLAYVATDPGTTNLYDIIQNATQLQGINGDLTGYYALGNDIDASVTSGWNDGAGFAPIGDDSSKFAGVFDGLGYAISDLVIDRPSEDYVGLFGYTDGATIRNVGIADAHIKGKHSSGILVGALDGIVISSWTSGFINGGAGVGGLIGGYGYGSGTILNSHSSATVSGSGNDIGGLMGHLSAGGVIRQSYATGNVSGVGGIAGLVGSIRGTIYDSYATGTANGSWYVGGLVGLNWENGKIYNSYSSTTVTGSGGGLVGHALSGSLTADSFWNTQTSGKSSSSGGIGKTTAQMQDPFTFIDAGWDFDSVWAKSSIGENNGYMMLPSAQAGTFYDSYLRLDALSRTYGADNPDLSDAASSVGVSVAWGSAITGTTGAGVYGWTDADVLTLTGGSNLYTQYGDGLTITPKVLDTGLTANNKVYDGNTNATIDGTLLLSGVINGDDVTLDGAVTTAAFEDANAGDGKTVIVNGLSLSGSGAGNYTLGLPSALTLSADITARPIDITADAGQSKVYGEADPTLAYTLEANGSGRGLVGSDSFSGALDRTAGENVGDYAIGQGTLANGNYDITFTGSNFSITPASLTIAAKSDLGKIYGDTYIFSASDLDVTGLKNAETIGNVDFSSTGAAATAGVNSGTPYTVTVSNATGGSFDAGNYSITYTNGALTINKANATVTANSATQTYNGLSQSVTGFTATGLVNGETESVLTGLTASGGTGTNAGDYAHSYTVGSYDGNYSLSFTDGKLTITQRPITVTADNKDKLQGTADPAFTWTVTAGNLVGGDTLSGTLNRDAGEAVGGYSIHASALANNNYAITAQDGTLTIAAVPPIEPPALPVSEAPDAGTLYKNSNQSTAATTDTGVATGNSGIGNAPSLQPIGERGGFPGLGSPLVTLAPGYVPFPPGVEETAWAVGDPPAAEDAGSEDDRRRRRGQR